MNVMTFSLLFVLILAGYAYLAWLDHRKDLQLIPWLNGEVSSPFKQNSSEPISAAESKKDEVQQLKERIQVLERIVTEPAYELNQKINQLR